MTLDHGRQFGLKRGLVHTDTSKSDPASLLVIRSDMSALALCTDRFGLGCYGNNTQNVM